jgi:dTDP-L-rhamnose 4-epimerase
MAKILITGGAGFIGSHLSDTLLEAGHHVVALDNLDPQVHGAQVTVPRHLHPDVEFVHGDVRDADLMERLVRRADAVYHFAALVGVGQSMYQVRNYMDVNTVGTAVLMEVLAKKPVDKLVVASSMSIYGEGLYQDQRGELVLNAERRIADLRMDRWEPMASDGSSLEPLPTPETKPPVLSSIYALSKFDQERICLTAGSAYGIPTTALRFFNVYGTRQALSNPYTGVLAIFSSRLLNNNPPLLFEDGRQKRDFIHVKDLARACMLALEAPASDQQVINLGSGNAYTVASLARRMAAILGKDHIEPRITGDYRVGDIRHCFADISKAREVLGFEPRIGLEEGMAELAEWLGEQQADDLSERAREELVERGLTV